MDTSLEIKFSSLNKFYESEYDTFSLFVLRADHDPPNWMLVYDKEEEQLYLGFIKTICTEKSYPKSKKSDYDKAYKKLDGNYIGEFIIYGNRIGVGVDVIEKIDLDLFKLNIVEYC